MGLLAVNDTVLYYELRGAGPPVLLVMGMTGDAGHFEAFADLLADEFTIVSYDRRGNGRSPRPTGWTTTSPEEQADDAAALLEALGMSPAVVYGSSAGGVFALCQLIRRPETVRGAILHDAALVRLFDEPGARAGVVALAREAREAGGPPLAIERLWRHVAGDANWERLEPDLRERMRSGARTFLDVEVGSYEGFLPDDRTLASIEPRVLVVAGEQTLPVYVQASRRLAERLGLELTRTPGTHTSYHDHPRELARTIRPFLRRVSARAVSDAQGSRSSSARSEPSIKKGTER
jgi:pimeloyl-ACP methyl ester carboxylesterase